MKANLPRSVLGPLADHSRPMFIEAIQNGPEKKQIVDELQTTKEHYSTTNEPFYVAPDDI